MCKGKTETVFCLCASKSAFKRVPTVELIPTYAAACMHLMLNADGKSKMISDAKIVIVLALIETQKIQ